MGSWNKNFGKMGTCDDYWILIGKWWENYWMKWLNKKVCGFKPATIQIYADFGPMKYALIIPSQPTFFHQFRCQSEKSTVYHHGFQTPPVDDKGK